MQETFSDFAYSLSASQEHRKRTGKPPYRDAKGDYRDYAHALDRVFRSVHFTDHLWQTKTIHGADYVLYGPWPFLKLGHEQVMQRPDDHMHTVDRAGRRYRVASVVDMETFERIKLEIAPEVFDTVKLVVRYRPKTLDDVTPLSTTINQMRFFHLAFFLNCWLDRVTHLPRNKASREEAIRILIGIYIQHFALEGFLATTIAKYAKDNDVAVVVPEWGALASKVPEIWATQLFPLHDGPSVVFGDGLVVATAVDALTARAMATYDRVMLSYGTGARFPPVPVTSTLGSYTISLDDTHAQLVGCRFYKTSDERVDQFEADEVLPMELTRRLGILGMAETAEKEGSFVLAIGIHGGGMSQNSLVKPLVDLLMMDEDSEPGGLSGSALKQFGRDAFKQYELPSKKLIASVRPGPTASMGDQIINDELNEKFMLALDCSIPLQEYLIDVLEETEIATRAMHWTHEDDELKLHGMPIFRVVAKTGPRGRVATTKTRMVRGDYYELRFAALPFYEYSDTLKMFQDYVLQIICRIALVRAGSGNLVERFYAAWEEVMDDLFSAIELLGKPCIAAERWDAISFEMARVRFVTHVSFMRLPVAFDNAKWKAPIRRATDKTASNNMATWGSVNGAVWTLPDPGPDATTNALARFEIAQRIPRAKFVDLVAGVTGSFFEVWLAYPFLGWNLNGAERDGEALLRAELRGGFGPFLPGEESASMRERIERVVVEDATRV